MGYCKSKKKLIYNLIILFFFSSLNKMILGIDFIGISKVLKRLSPNAPARGKAYNKVILYKIAQYVQKKLNITKCSKTLILGGYDELCTTVMTDGDNNNYIVVGDCLHNSIKICRENSNGRWLKEATLNDHDNSVLSVAVIPGKGGNNRIVSGSSNGTIKVWVKKSGTGWEKESTLIGHSSMVYSVAVILDSGTNHRIVSGGWDQTVRVWREDKNDGGWSVEETLIGHHNIVRSVAVIPDNGNNRIVSGSGSELKVWREKIGGGWVEEANLNGYSWKRRRGHRCFVTSVAVMPDGRIVSGSHDKTVKIWREGRKGEWVDEATLSGHSSSVTDVAVIPDGRIVSGSDDNTMKVWRDVGGEWKEYTTFSGHSDCVTCVAVMSDGRIVSGSQNCMIKICGVYE